MGVTVKWYRRKTTLIVGGCAVVLLCVGWFWRDWVGLGLETQVRANTVNAFKWALNTSAAESTSFQKVDSGDKTFYLPNYDPTDAAGMHNMQNLKSLFVDSLSNKLPMPMFRIESVQIVPTTTMQYTARIRYATWLGLNKTIAVSGNPPIPHKR
ncbi:hypothetical protein [Alicyclobacillus sp. SO9]|uniref:hypothetical protein n=1 Tax=Alicyclobacillus sp. SO9 TaxID=2665646 RepID=UPI0018E78C79|nr:hypothetical protein [Alicyclobacillus sp. SO9]QQE80011.1 hypothetical protein GI364_05935 [Alicyclobacillus sp. SO9]